MLSYFYSNPVTLARILSTSNGRYLDGFAATLKQAGFSRDSAQWQLHIAAHFCAWQHGRGCLLAEWDDASVAQFKAHLGACACDGFRPANIRCTGAALLLRYLRGIGVVSASPEQAFTGAAASPLFHGFCEWMRRHRGARDATLQAYGRIIIDVIHTLGENPQDYGVAALRAFVLDRANRHGKSKAKLVVSALRTFLRYLTTENMCSVGLVAAINQKGAPLST